MKLAIILAIALLGVNLGSASIINIGNERSADIIYIASNPTYIDISNKYPGTSGGLSVLSNLYGPTSTTIFGTIVLWDTTKYTPDSLAALIAKELHTSLTGGNTQDYNTGSTVSPQAGEYNIKTGLTTMKLQYSGNLLIFIGSNAGNDGGYETVASLSRSSTVLLTKDVQAHLAGQL